MIKKVRGSFWNAVFDIFIATVVFIMLFSLAILWGLLWGVFDFSTQALAWATIFMALVLGILLGLVGFFLTKRIKIEFVKNIAFSESTRHLNRKFRYNATFLEWIGRRLIERGPFSVREYLLFIEEKFDGYFRGEGAKGTYKRSWDKIQVFALSFLNPEEKYYKEAAEEIRLLIRDTKRGEIEIK